MVSRSFLNYVVVDECDADYLMKGGLDQQRVLQSCSLQTYIVALALFHGSATHVASPTRHGRTPAPPPLGALTCETGGLDSPAWSIVEEAWPRVSCPYEFRSLIRVRGATSAGARGRDYLSGW